MKSVSLRVTCGVEGGIGWVGDVKDMLLDASKINRYGWKPKLCSAEAVRLAVKENLRK